MSTTSRQSDEKPAGAETACPSGGEQANLPACRPALPPANPRELTEEERERLEQLARRANLAHDLAQQAALQFCRHSIEAGMALLEAQDLCPEKTWLAWLADHFDGSARTAQRYMQQANTVIALGGDATDLSHHHPGELSRLFSGALKRLERRRATAPVHAERPARIAVTRESGDGVKVDHRLPSEVDDPLATVVALFDELLAALNRTIASGRWLEYGAFVLGELERIRGDVDACRLLVCDARAAASAVA